MSSTSPSNFAAFPESKMMDLLLQPIAALGCYMIIRRQCWTFCYRSHNKTMTAKQWFFLNYASTVDEQHQLSPNSWVPTETEQRTFVFFCKACIIGQERRRWKEEYRCVSCKLHRKWKIEKVGEKEMREEKPTSKEVVTELKVEASMWRPDFFFRKNFSLLWESNRTRDLQLRRRACYLYATTTA